MKEPVKWPLPRGKGGWVAAGESGEPVGHWNEAVCRPAPQAAWKLHGEFRDLCKSRGLSSRDVAHHTYISTVALPGMVAGKGLMAPWLAALVIFGLCCQGPPLMPPSVWDLQKGAYTTSPPRCSLQSWVIQEVSGLPSEGTSEGNQYTPDAQRFNCQKPDIAEKYLSASECGSSVDGHPEVPETKDGNSLGSGGEWCPRLGARAVGLNTSGF
ncbi:hypothetical protein P7K49_024484 [Saguinus oedipus]|uniref:Uncharacterized protein n=1 Tax=Saguinus oedipus TaxID=9490 RepID=A0ABQ9UPN1_SAGOE|nr:hypothetical protein P7K49_024484 [Saguinus oedipus]